jgi:hypothetical protein
MARDTEDTRKPRLRCVQIKGAQDDPLLMRLDKFSKKMGIPVASVARLLLKEGLDRARNEGRE